MSGDGSDVVGITQRELLMEMRDDVRALRAAGTRWPAIRRSRSSVGRPCSG